MASFADISKAVGWEARPVAIPSIERANQVLEKAKSGDVDAVRLALRFNRFCLSPENDTEVVAINLIHTAMIEGRRAIEQQ